jgi:acyl-CoA hydrolase
MKTLTPADAVTALARHASGGRVFLSAGPAEPVALHDAWRAAPETAAGLSFAGLFIPGVNRLDYAGLHADARMELFMLSPDWRAGLVSGRTRLRPLHYSAAFAALVSEGAAAGVFTVSAPDAQGQCSFGLAADAPPAMLTRTGFKLAVVNHAMPAIPSAPRVALSAFDAVVETDTPLPELAAAPATATATAIAARVAALVEDGDTIQTGIGKLPLAAVEALAARRDLHIHSGLVAPAHLALADAGALADAPAAIRAGIAVGDAAFYRRLATEQRLSLVSVSETHGADALARINRLVAINAALEVDLFGQVNAEFAGAEQISGVGGLVDFVRGARASRGGRPIVMLQAEGKGGASRILPRLNANAVTISRADAPILVTEFGAVDLAPLDIDARAAALIALAPPAARDDLSRAWSDLRKTM